MSYANGIGSSQPAINSVASSVATPAPTVTTENKNDAVSSYVQNADQAVLSAPASFAAQASESSDVRSTKVAALQQAIAAGEYNVSSSDVADKMIQSLLE